jgi:DNA polymerase beta
MKLNNKIIDIFSKMAIIEKSNRFKYIAYIRAIKIIQDYNKVIKSSDDIRDYYDNNFRIGDKLLLKIDEIIKTGTLSVLPTKSVSNIDKLTRIMGIGNKRAIDLVKMDINNITQLRGAYKNLRVLLTHEQQLGIKYYANLQHKIPRKQMNIYNKIFKDLVKQLNPNLKYIMCGSYRRELQKSGDIDVLLSYPELQQINHETNDSYIFQFIKKLKELGMFVDTISIGNTKYSGLIRLSAKNRCVRRLDIRVLPIESYYTGILYYTGNRDFNIQMRRKALELGYSLSEYRLLNKTNNTIIPITSETEIFEKLKMIYVEPKNRNI